MAMARTDQNPRGTMDHQQPVAATDTGPDADHNAEVRPGAGAAADEGTPARPSASFDPTPYLRQLRGRGGGQDYLDVKWRLLWLRKEHPDAEIMTEHVQIEPTLAIFKATVSLPTGGKATGYGSETAGDFGDFIEKAETKAIGRALNALGYGAQFGERGGEEADDRVASPSPAARPPAARPRPVVSPSDGAATSVVAKPPPESESEAAVAGDRAATSDDAPAPLDFAAGRDRAGQRPPSLPSHPEPMPAATAPSDQSAVPELPAPLAVPRGRKATEPVTAPTDESGGEGKVEAAAEGVDADLADYSWTAFWPWARALGLNGPKAVEALIGEATAGFTPLQLRERILTARNES